MASSGRTVGTYAPVAVATVGVSVQANTGSTQQPISPAFVLTNAGLMAMKIMNARK
jgi:lipid-binding SYLF domain-containing protein